MADKSKTILTYKEFLILNIVIAFFFFLEVLFYIKLIINARIELNI